MIKQVGMNAWQAGFGAVLLLTSVVTQAAKPVPPPSQQLLTDENIVAIVTVQGKPSAEHLLLKSEQLLHGEAFVEQKVGIDKTTAANVQVGERYLVSFSWFVKDPLTRGKGWVKNSAGPEVIGFTEVERFIVPAHPALVALLQLSAEPVNDSARIDNALQLLASDNDKLRSFASLEFMLTSRLWSGFNSHQRDQLKTTLMASGYSPQHRDLMYRVALSLPAPLQGEWLSELARKELATLGSQYDLASRVPGLAKTATQVLREHGNSADVPLLSELLRSNAPGVAKMALQALAKQGAETASMAVGTALADKNLPAESRRVLEIYRKSGKLPG